MKALNDLGNDAIIRAAMPAIEKFLGPLMEDARSHVHGLFTGPPPGTLKAELDGALDAELSTPQVQAIWAATVRAVAEGR